MNDTTSADDTNTLWLIDQQVKALTDQSATSAVVKQPLHTLSNTASPVSEGFAVPSTVQLAEMPMSGMLVLRVRQGHPHVAQAAHHILGSSLPKPLRCLQIEDVSVCWISPDEWLISLPLADVHTMELAWQQQLEGQFAIVNVTAGFVQFELSGMDAQTVLGKSTGYDVHLDNFPVGKVVSTTLAKTTATLIHAAPDHYVVVVRRSFADYVWRWIDDAGAEFGLKTAI